MDPFNDKSSELGRRSSLRRSSLRGSLRLSISANPEEDGNLDFVEAMVADGFRPSQSSLLPPTPSPQSATPSPSEIHQFSVLGDPSLERPSSTAKPSRPHDFLTLRHDGSDTESDPSPPAPLSNVPQLRPQSPYRGPSAPSHPYQMYQQRTLSIASSSTNPPITNMSYEGPRGPAHPYALYTQNIASSDDENPESQIPVGFSNAGADGSYQRQLGPDGEEAGGLIGPLGHTEELPPYSRYPNQPFAPKTSLEASQGAGSTNVPLPLPAPLPLPLPVPVSALEQVMAGAGGIGVATRNPEFSATEEDLAPVRSRSRPSAESHHEINTAAREVAEKPPLNKWQRRAKKKLWGIVPYWAICLTVIAVVLIGVILGAVIGTVLSHHTKAPPDAGDQNGPYDDNASATSMPDVQPLPTYPANLQPLDIGCFSFPSFSAYQAPQDCFADSSQSSAWSCDMSPWSFLMNISHSYEAKSSNQGYNLTITAQDVSDPHPWGMQPFQLTTPVKLTLVNEVFDDSYGPAWWMELTYNKTVIVPSNSLQANTKRWHQLGSFANDAEALAPRKRADTLPDETCWICTWPETTLEIFIYPNQSAGPPPPPPTAPAAAQNSSSKSPYGSPSNNQPVYPKPIKFVERRHPEPDDKASCRQVRIIDNGQNVQNVTYDNKPVEIYINENPNSWEAKSGGGPSGYKSRAARDQGYHLSQCACLWWL